MDHKYDRDKAHKEIDHIFQDLFPAHSMGERPEQAALSHRMLDTMLDGNIALCDAGTGIGKTYAYLVAGMVYSLFRAANGLEVRPIIISTSSIALQNAVCEDYLPFLSRLLLEDGLLTEPLRAVIRKGKRHYVCDERLRRSCRPLIWSGKIHWPGKPCCLCGTTWTWIWRNISALTTGNGSPSPRCVTAAQQLQVPVLHGGVRLRSLPGADLQP